MRTADFDFALPPELIAQQPTPARDASRLMVLHRGSGELEHREFRDLAAYLIAGDVLVLNDSKVIPARLRAVRRSAPASGPADESQRRATFEILLLEQNSTNDWWAMMRPGKRARVGAEFLLLDAAARESGIGAVVLDVNAEGHRRLQFKSSCDILDSLESIGEIPLPPYIRRDTAPGPQAAALREADRVRYQTVYARDRGSVAAPTAGLHFTPGMLETLAAQGVEIQPVTLHVGPGTFAPVKAGCVEDHVMHDEIYEVAPAAAEAINRAKAAGRRVIAVGTTSVRVLESVARRNEGRLAPGRGRTNIFLYPPAQFGIVDALVTNFHLPQSTLQMLVSAFAAPGGTAGRETILRAYAAAVRERYRFFSYGDAMLIL